MRYFLLCILAFLLLVMGCRASKPISDTRPAGDIGVEVWASSDCVEPGETVKLRATATNHSSEPFEVELSDKPVFDLVVKTGGETTRWSEGEKFTSNLTRFVLKPKEAKTIEMDWQVRGPDNLLVNAQFIDNPKFADHPIEPFLLVQVQHCVGPFGP